MWLGIDIGTSAVKAVLLAEGGEAVAQADAALSVSRPQPMWSEQDPQAWWSAVNAAVLGLDAKLRQGVRGVGLAGQMHGATLLGPDQAPLRPAILWNDGRSGAECVALEQDVPELHAVAGNLAMPGFTAPKLLWVRRHEPEVFARVRTVLLPKDYVRLRMTGELASDVSDSAGTLWLDVAARAWSERLLAACGLDMRTMPALYEGPQTTGVLRQEVASSWGMARVPVVAGGSDNAAGAVGAGAVGDGQALLSLGTSGVIFVANDAFRPNPARAVHAFCHCVPSMWHQMSVHLSAASCIDWVKRLTGLEHAKSVFAQAEAATEGAEVFLPYLSGERTPHNDPHARGMFLSLDHETDSPRLCRAVLEGVAFALSDGLDALAGAGANVDELSVIGGGARSAFWGRLIAAVLNRRLIYRTGAETGPALGAARLAHIGVGGAAIADVCAPTAIAAVIEPDADLGARLAPKRRRFRLAYEQVRTDGEAA